MFQQRFELRRNQILAIQSLLLVPKISPSHCKAAPLLPLSDGLEYDCPHQLRLPRTTSPNRGEVGEAEQKTGRTLDLLETGEVIDELSLLVFGGGPGRLALLPQRRQALHQLADRGAPSVRRREPQLPAAVRGVSLDDR